MAVYGQSRMGGYQNRSKASMEGFADKMSQAGSDYRDQMQEKAVAGASAVAGNPEPAMKLAFDKFKDKASDKYSQVKEGYQERMNDDKGLFQGGKMVNPFEGSGGRMQEGLANVRKSFGDRMDAMKQYVSNKDIGGVTPTVMAEPTVVQASTDGNMDGAITLDEQSGQQGMAGPTQATPGQLPFDASQTPLDKLSGEQLGQWGKYFDIENPTMNQYANWQTDSARSWNGVPTSRRSQ